jgi:hypothetical protein
MKGKSDGLYLGLTNPQDGSSVYEAHLRSTRPNAATRHTSMRERNLSTRYIADFSGDVMECPLR